jgi:uncharacterized repeat protein (TIGR03803 family)
MRTSKWLASRRGSFSRVPIIIFVFCAGAWTMASIVFLFCAVAVIAAPAQNFTTLHMFAGYPSDGGTPNAGLLLATDGNFYGTTYAGGTSGNCQGGCGTVFRITPGGTLTTLHSFDFFDGASPTAALVQGTDGNIYGTTYGGGANQYYGTVFKITPSGTFTSLYSFCAQSNCVDGAMPYAGLVRASDGNFYGTTLEGGSHTGCSLGSGSCGTVFKITPGGALTTLYNFCAQPSCADGGNPYAGLVQASDGNFYGTTFERGANGYGTVFKITPAGTLTALYSFCSQTNCADGQYPYAGLVQATDGNLYGSTSAGGGGAYHQGGTVFKITPSGTQTTIYNFCSQPNCTDGDSSVARLVQASDGTLYGTTLHGGAFCVQNSGCGTVFRITPSGTLTTLHSFDDTDDGKTPFGGLVQASDGNFYGTATYGANPACTAGLHGCGTVFRLTGPQLIPTTTVLMTTPNPSIFGQPVIITAAVGPSGATGTVSFTSNGTGISGCTSVTLTSGMAVCITTGLAVGTDAIVATYSGDGNYAGSSGMLSQIVNPVPTPVQFFPVPPCRVVDTRRPNGTFGGPAIPGNSTRSFPLSEGDNPCGIPPSAVAYSLNVTVVPLGGLGYLSIWPTGQGQPIVSTLNSSDGRVKANAAIVPAGTPSGAVSVFVTDTTHLILDIDGYFAPPAQGSLQFYPLTPCRILDTRGGQHGGTLQAGQERDYPMPGNCALPPSAAAYSFNITVLPARGGLDYLTVWPAGGTRPIVSTLNDDTGTVAANAAIVPAGNGTIAFYPNNNNTDLLVDTNGYFAAPGQGGYSFYAVTPCRVYDSRANNGQPFRGTRVVDVADSQCGPPNAQAYVFNATVVPTNGPMGYLTLWPNGQDMPIVSTLNAYDGFVTSNMAIVPNMNGSIDTYTDGITHLILDISGYFAP